MKNSFKLGALALIIAVSFSACSGSKSTSSSDSTTKVDSTVKKDSLVTPPDSSKKDSTVKK